MKLKEALKVAKRLGYGCIAVDEAGNINGYYDIYIYTMKIDFRYDATGRQRMVFLGTYTGSKNWKDTLREVK